MSRPEKIGAAEALKSLPGWSAAPGGRDAIQRSFKFADFNAAFGFMARVALMAEKLDHHPEWSNIYNRIDVTLATHDADGVTELDVRLATFMDEAAGRVPTSPDAAASAGGGPSAEEPMVEGENGRL